MRILAMILTAVAAVAACGANGVQTSVESPGCEDREIALNARLPRIFAKAAAHYRALDAAAAPLMKKNDAPDARFYPHSWNKAVGRLSMHGVRSWTAGHFPGSLWYLYEATGDGFFKERAIAWTEIVAPNSKASDNHDVGFIMYCSFGNARRILNTGKYDTLLLEAAASLSKRFDSRLGLIRSWGEIGDTGAFLVIPDNLMNLELLEWASKAKGGNARFDSIARSHADATMRNHFRADGGAYHVLDYNQADGRVKGIRRGQGASCLTAWSRGQSWAVYGYTMMYRHTLEARYLDFAMKLADFAINNPNMPADGVPYWDYGAPGEERDSSAAAILASALLELAEFSGCGKGAAYRAFAVKQLLSLSSPAYFSEGGESGHFLLKHGVGNKPGKSEVDVPLNYGDYYFLEALLRFRKSGPPAAPSTPARHAANPAKQLLASHPADCPDELYLDFTRTGNRTRYQKRIMQRTENLEMLAELEHAEKKGRFVAKTKEYLLAFAGMRSWVLPAHDRELKVFGGKDMYADLGAVRICLAVAEALDACGARLDAATVELMRGEMRRRVFDPCLKSAAEVKACGKPSNPGQWWFRTANNWNAVCHSCIVRAALLAFPQGSAERDTLVEAAVDAAPFYLNGFSADGYCSEGAVYWNYGFGHFLLMGRALAAAPEKIDVFAKFPKAKSVARYGFEYVLDSAGVSPMFADGGSAAPDVRFTGICREIWPDLENAADKPRSTFPDAQVWIFRPGGGRRGISIGLKGGHNNELHNHNDVGSYNISVDGIIMAGDPGDEIYTKRTFSPRRYESMILNSYAHPVPRAGGALQGTGARFRAKLLACENTPERDTVALDIRAAYPDVNLRSLVRTFTYSRASGAVAIKDVYKFAKPSKFVSPVVTLGAFAADGTISRDGAFLSVSAKSEGGDASWFEETVENPGRPDVHIRGIKIANAVEGFVEFVFRVPD